VDVLSEVLKAVVLDGAVFYNAELSKPWGFRAPPSRELAPHLAPEGRHVIIFHLFAEGAGTAVLASGERVDLEPGDIVVFPHGDPHTLRNGSPAAGDIGDPQIERILAEGLKLARQGGGGEITRLFCGFLACEPRLGRVMLEGLPPIFKVNVRGDATGRWIEQSIRFSVEDAGDPVPGRAALLAKLAEALFVETLRRYVSHWPEGRAGWLAAAHDPEVGHALALMHRRPAHPWQLAELAKESGLSRSVLAERFRSFLKQTPMAYLTRWRLRLGARLLTTSSRSVAQIASEVGYESEAAFNRAFKREFGAPPARFRSLSKTPPAAPPTTAAKPRPRRAPRARRSRRTRGSLRSA
jgi:AraC-like DNA-binding protein